MLTIFWWAVGIVAIEIVILAIFNFIFGFVRNEAVFNIRIRWVYNSDPRHRLYSYEEMYNSSRYNKYGFRVPKQEMFNYKEVE